MRKGRYILSALFILLAGSARSVLPVPPVVWTTPSKDALDSMPLSGRSGAGANVWVQGQSIWLYLDHNGAYEENGDLVKLGCIRLTPADVNLGADGFEQKLDPAAGTIMIRQGDFSVSLCFAGETLVVESTRTTPHSLGVAFGVWRDNLKITADETGVAWSHRNADYPLDVVGNAAKQGIARAAVHDATTRRVFGGALVVDGGLSKPVESKVTWQNWPGRAWTGKTAAKTRHTITVALGANLDGHPDEWSARAKALLDSAVRQAARADERARWREFWGRSHIVIDPDAKADDPGRLVGQNYQLFRYMLACNRDGELPLLFNGGIFTTDVAPGRITGNTYALKDRPGQTSPDFRRWGQTHFMSQNERWLGWPTLAAGDPDLLAPTLAFYRDRAAAAASRARTNGAEGVVYPEPMDVWGLCTVKPLPNGFCSSQHLTYHFSMMVEIAWMALQARDALGIDIRQDLPWIEGTVLFYDSVYRAQCQKRTGKDVGDDGNLVLYPSNALELLSGATNPIEVVSGLRRVTAGLLALPDLPADTRMRFEAIQARLPELPMGERDGVRSLLPAKSYEGVHNKWEPIEMYAFWPYRWVGVTRPDTLQLARDTWKSVPKDRRRCVEQDYSWMANVANVAALAWPAEAKKRVIYKLANNDQPQARFPAFFGPGHDWIPDHNWGGSGMVGLQEMLLAPAPGPAGKLNLFPSWPPEWDVDFKLHAPGPTVVECVYRKGKIEKLLVTPSSRAKDVVNWLGNRQLPPRTAAPDTGQSHGVQIAPDAEQIRRNK